MCTKSSKKDQRNFIIAALFFLCSTKSLNTKFDLPVMATFILLKLFCKYKTIPLLRCIQIINVISMLFEKYPIIQGNKIFGFISAITPTFDSVTNPDTTRCGHPQSIQNTGKENQEPSSPGAKSANLCGVYDTFTYGASKATLIDYGNFVEIFGSAYEKATDDEIYVDHLYRYIGHYTDDNHQILQDVKENNHDGTIIATQTAGNERNSDNEENNDNKNVKVKSQVQMNVNNFIKHEFESNMYVFFYVMIKKEFFVQLNTRNNAEKGQTLHLKDEQGSFMLEFDKNCICKGREDIYEYLGLVLVRDLNFFNNHNDISKRFQFQDIKKEEELKNYITEKGLMNLKECDDSHECCIILKIKEN